MDNTIVFYTFNSCSIQLRQAINLECVKNNTLTYDIELKEVT